MKTLITKLNPKSGLFILLVLLFVFLSADIAYSKSKIETYQFNTEYKIKRIPNGTVSVYTLNDNGDKEEYLFQDFNADVVLSIYRKLNLEQITSVLARKYYLSETESRRDIKRTINVLEKWGIVSRKTF